MYFAQLRHHQENTESIDTDTATQYCLYSPDDALIVRNIYVEIL